MITPEHVVLEYFDSLKRSDFARLTALLDADIVWHQPGNNRLSKTYQGKSAVIALFQEFMTFSGGTFRIDDVSSVMVNGNWVAAILRFSAQRHAEGLSMSMSGVDLMRVEGGLIVEVRLFSEDQHAEDIFWGTQK